MYISNVQCVFMYF
uniref:Uncharacterized protein n=1 Tax=Anguilla anguilla TaxID=7936 RepID=A0A0E9XRC4_ANGAN